MNVAGRLWDDKGRIESRIMLTRILTAVALVLGACAAPTQTASGPASIPIEILKPDGAGPFPAVVMLHDCSGLGPRSSGAPRRWARELVNQGYVVAIPDSFSTRGHVNGVCTDPSPSRNEVSPLRRVEDAYEALAMLKAMTDVDGEHIGVMGGSHGGSATLATVANARTGFAAAIALYPGCHLGRPQWTTEYKTTAPLLILAGELDDWTPAKYCVELVEAARRSGSPAEIKVYPGAHHAFDSAKPVRYLAARVNSNAAGGRGATTGGNTEAWADSRRQVSAFFTRYLRR